MISRIDLLAVELAPPSEPDVEGARIVQELIVQELMVQELMGGRFGKMSALMNYTFQSFNIPAGRRHARSST
jgi:Mn-containing catalase